MSFVLLILPAILLLSIYFLTRYKNLPPGPLFSFPLIGHLTILGENPHRKLLEWKRIYGPIISCQLGSFQAVILIDGKIIREAFNLPTFSGRCAIKPFVDASCNKGIIFGDTSCHVEHREFFLKNLKNFASNSIETKIQDELVIFLNWIKMKVNENKDGLITVNGMFQCPVINSSWSILMGERFENDDPKLDQLGEKIATGFLRTDTFAKKVGLYMPWAAKYLPSLSGYKDICGSLKEIYDYIQHRLEQRKLSWTLNEPRDITDVYFDMTAKTTDVTSVFHKTNDAQRYATGEMFFAALDPTGKTLEWLMYFIARDRVIHSRFQNEIDMVVGQNRLPSLSDRPLMPYTRAIINELLRITTTGAMAMFHRTTEDISNFHGYKIPKDTMVISNLWGCCNDPSVWDQPETFIPERFLEENKIGKKFDNFVTFGVGNRNCIGEGVARDQLFLISTSLFQKFDVFLEDPDAPPVKEIYGLNLSADIFRVKFTPRNKN